MKKRGVIVSLSFLQLPLFYLNHLHLAPLLQRRTEPAPGGKEVRSGQQMVTLGEGDRARQTTSQGVLGVKAGN